MTKKMKPYLIVIFSLVAPLLAVFSAKAEKSDISALEIADVAYNSGDYSRAVEIYDSVMQREGTSASALFNLGNAYYKTGDMGRARICYERARRLAPRNKEILNNLAYLTSKVDDANVAMAGKDKERVTQDAESFWHTVHNTIAVESTSDSWALLAVMAFVLLIGAVALYIFSRNVAARKAGFFSAIIFLVCSASFVAIAFISASESESGKNVVLTGYKVSLLKEPREDAQPSWESLTQGTRLKIEDEETDASGKPVWYMVRLNSRLSGWVKASELEVI